MLCIVFVAALIRSAFGFGEALIAVPLLAFCIPLQAAAPLAVLLSITIAAIVVIQDWKQIHFQSAGWLLLATLPGLPLGLLLLASGHQRLARGLLGAVIAGFAGWSLARQASVQPPRDSRAWLAVCGFCAGVLGGAYGMNGPPLVIYGSLRRWSPQQFRATLQAYFLPASLLAMAGFRATGLWTPVVTHDYWFSLPALVPALFLGRLINHRMRGEIYLQFVFAGLAVIGAVLIIQAIAGRI
ncbi:MAG: sulfite exporter TauE/SafE family protein [Acidobacteriaceae bacterium]